MDIDLVIQSPPGGDWMYQWRVTLPGAGRFAICNPCRLEYRRLGMHDGRAGARGCRAAMSILHEAGWWGNKLLADCASAGGRIPAR